MGHISASLASVPLPSTSPKNKCFGEAPLPCGAGRRFLLPMVAENIVWKGRFCRDKKGGQKVSYSPYNLSAKKSPPTLYKEWGGKFWQSLKINISITNIFFPYFFYDIAIII